MRGGMIRYHANRVSDSMTRLAVQTAREAPGPGGLYMRRAPGVQLEMFCGDTAIHGALAPLQCGLDLDGGAKQKILSGNAERLIKGAGQKG